jgi:uncharacterized protein (TIGR02391 family)
MTPLDSTGLRLIAIQVGDELKFDVTLNDIDRAASALFRFQKESFPHHAITSQRAQLVYDWLLSLAKQRMADEERQTLITRFCLAISPDSHRPTIERILTDGGIVSTTAGREQRAALASRNLHSAVVLHAGKYFLQHNYFHAVFEASKAYNKAVQEKAVINKDGQDLMLAAWGCEKGVLKVTPCATDTDRNVQDGIKFLSAGLMAAIRNPTAHEPAVDWPIGRDDCLDILGLLSFLYRKLDAAVRAP